MATSMESFDIWLTEKLTSLSPDFDTDVFVSYIVSILDTETPTEETAENIKEILAQVLDESQCKGACQEIIDQWIKEKGAKDMRKKNEKDIGEKLAELMGKQSLATVKGKKLTDEERARKEAILAQYSQVSDGEATDEEPDDPGGASSQTSSGGHKGKGEPGDPLLTRNLNSALVMQAERDQREKSKQEHEKKKEKDRQDRDAQRQKQQERKEAEKKRTQKGERRR
ncbi:coiled-coil domain-containing protein 43-like [Pomacea canaliculata]|uniref:coiled-coil domain-containing protein 43-like n=1 Tax=Pomacea canaliculata TaxID=400727 RepID=UPI000D7364F1|nr:coiled-coil domain-containing protein 43-like [Pomacea canaliculata]